MKKKATKGMCALLTAVLVMSGMLITNVKTAKAAIFEYNKKETQMILTGKNYPKTSSLYMSSRTKDCTKVTVSLSKKSVAKVKVKKFKRSGHTYRYFIITPKKSGKTTIKIKVYKKGKVKTYKQKILCAKYQNPFKSVLLNGKDITNKLKSYDVVNNKITGNQASLNVKLNKNWKIVKATCYGNEYPLKDRNYTNGTTLSVSKEGDILFNYTVKNKKTGAIEYLEIYASNY